MHTPKSNANNWRSYAGNITINYIQDRYSKSHRDPPDMSDRQTDTQTQTDRQTHILF